MYRPVVVERVWNMSTMVCRVPSPLQIIELSLSHADLFLFSRIDLRPADADNTANPAITTTSVDGVTTDGTSSPPAPGETAREAERRRERGGISIYLEHHLGINLQSQPEERIAALRRLRNENRGDESGGEESHRRRNRLSGVFRDRGEESGGEDRRRNRLSGVLRDRFSRRSSRNEGGGNPSSEGEAGETGGPTPTATGASTPAVAPAAGEATPGSGPSQPSRPT